MSPSTLTLISVCLGSSVIVAILNFFFERARHKRDRKELLQDNAQSQCGILKQDIEKLGARVERIITLNKETAAAVEEIKEGLDKNTEGTKTILRACLKSLGEDYLRDNKIDSDEWEEWLNLWEIYHYNLEGNGYLDSIKNKLEKLYNVSEEN